VGRARYTNVQEYTLPAAVLSTGNRLFCLSYGGINFGFKHAYYLGRRTNSHFHDEHLVAIGNLRAESGDSFVGSNYCSDVLLPFNAANTVAKRAGPSSKSDDLEDVHLPSTHLQADGHVVLQAFDGPSGLAAVEQHHPHLIILDWMLPGIDGLAVCRRVRQKYLTPIIMLTARTEEVDQILGLEVGADDYISKPFSIRQVLARVRAMLRRVELDSQSSMTTETSSHEASSVVALDTPPPLVRGPLQIHLAEHIVRLNGQEIELTPKEYDLLVLLASHPGWVFKREVLIQQIWGDSYEGFDRTIDNHITRLRKKLGPVGEKIDTVWGVGYRFVE